jgi:flagellar L-ring protein precursor FlgH
MHVLAVAAAAVAVPARAESLYDEGTFRPLTSDAKAFRVGDAITVQVVELSSATSKTDTATRRRNTTAASVAWAGKNPASAGQLSGNVAVAGEFDGGGTTNRSNKLLATLTASVTEVLPGGDLVVAGEQSVIVNEEQQRVTVKGRVRPRDVSGDNVVLSTRIADAHITYSGAGDLSERQRRSWWRKLLDWAGL